MMPVLRSSSERLREAWVPTWREIWQPLLRRSRTPPDLVIELLRKVAEERTPTRRGISERAGIFLMAAALNRLDLDEDLSSTRKATLAFRQLRSDDFLGGSTVARFLEAADQVIGEFEEPRLISWYRQRLARFIGAYNLPYSVLCPPLRLRARFPSAIDEAYAALELAAASDDHLSEALEGFARTWADFFEQDRPADLTAAIDKAAKVAEAFAGQRAGCSGSLGDLIDRLRRARHFPHAALAASVKSLYGFCSEYPHIRHAGNPDSKLRSLERRDVLFVSLLLVAFAGYATTEAAAAAAAG